MQTKPSPAAIEAAKRLIHTQMIGVTGLVRFAEIIQETVVAPLEKRVAELEGQLNDIELTVDALNEKIFDLEAEIEANKGGL
jgi:hypothetical protein